MIVPFQLDIMISSPSSRPYEQEPSPIPFSPFSSSSRSLKLRGTEMISQIGSLSLLCDMNIPLAMDWNAVLERERREGEVAHGIYT